MTVIVDEKNFKEDVLQSETPVLVDFYAEWCGPCKALMPTIEEIAIEYAEKIKVVKIDDKKNFIDTGNSFSINAVSKSRTEYEKNIHSDSFVCYVFCLFRMI